MRGAAGNQLSFFSFFFLLLIIGGGIVIGVLIYYGSGSDYRADDVRVVSGLLERCVREGIFAGTLASCGFSEDAVQKVGYSITLCDGDCFVKKANVLVHTGDSVQTCRLQVKNAENYPRCVEQTFRVQGKQYMSVVGSLYRGRSA